MQFEALSVKKVQNITLLNLEYCYCKESFCNWFSSPKPLVHSKKLNLPKNSVRKSSKKIAVINFESCNFDVYYMTED